MSVSTAATDPTIVDTGTGVVARPAVPWRFVLTVSVVMAFADDYWTTSLRGAFGAIERTQDPFGGWWRESVVLVPLFVFAVLGALALVTRFAGAGLPGRRAVLRTCLVVALGGSCAGVGALVLSTVEDLRLEGSQVHVMAAMRDPCPTGRCAEIQRQATVALQERSVLMGAAFILLTNLVLVGWVVAAGGGRLPARPARPTGPGRAGLDSPPVRLLLASLVGSALIHAAVVPEHLAEWPAAGVFFVGLTVAELGVAVLVLRGPRPWTLHAVAWCSVGPLLLWLVSRTTGLPLGPDAGVPEEIGVADVAACLLELTALVVAVTLLARPHRVSARATTPHSRWLLVAGALAVTAIGFSGSGVAGLDGFGSTVSGSSTHAGHH